MNVKEAAETIKARLQTKERTKSLLHKAKHGGFVCPYCGSGSGQKGTGAVKVYEDGGFWCNKCHNEKNGGHNGSVIDVYMSFHSVDFRQAVEDLGSECGIYLDVSAAANKPQARKESGNVDGKTDSADHEENQQDFLEYCEKVREGITDALAVEYLKKRGISIETAQRLNVGFDGKWINPDGGKYPSPRIIFPYDGGRRYFARGLDDAKGCKQQGGKGAGIFNREALDHDVCFVCEAAFDAASVEECGYHAVGLNGARNFDPLLRVAKNFDGVFVIAFDNDEAGRNDAKNLKEELDALGVCSIVAGADICGDVDGQDINEFLVKDRDGFSFSLLEAEGLARRELERAESPDSLAEYVTSGKWREDVERGKNNREKTGFRSLDDWLGGGLYEGLTVVSGFPSLGKTSLLWQIAENVAVAGCHVIFFSLEMSKGDMISKSLSRRAFEQGRDVTSDDAQSGRDDCKKELKGLLEDVGNHLEVIEGSFGYGFDRIAAKAKRASRKHKRLALFVDYLQAAAEYGGKAETVAIAETAKAFRQLAREIHAPVICASSTARANYGGAVDYNIFYGSGGIESAADCAAGLQLTAIYSQEFKNAGQGKNGKELQAAIIDRAKKEDAWEVAFIGLKNRRGKMTTKICFMFDARHCTFTESTGATSETLSADDLEALLDFSGRRA